MHTAAFNLAEFTQDARYAQAVARVRVLEKRLLTRRQCIRMAEARTDEALADELRGTDYAEPLANVRRPDELPFAFDRLMQNRRRLASELQIPSGMMLVWERRKDFDALKVAFRTKRSSRPDGEVLSRLPEAIRARFDHGSQLPEPLEAGFLEAAADFERHQSTFRLDMALDRAFAAQLREAFDAPGVPFLWQFVRHYLDVQVLCAVVRWRTWLEGAAPPEARAARVDVRLLPPGGFLRTDHLAAIAIEPWERAGSLLQHTAYGPVLRDGIEHFQKTGAWWLLEKRADDLVSAFCRLTRYTAFGLEPLITYGWFVLQETRNVRMIVAARLAGLETDLVIPRLREGYDA